jgi:hypothetical protein
MSGDRLRGTIRTNPHSSEKGEQTGVHPCPSASDRKVFCYVSLNPVRARLVVGARTSPGRVSKQI